MERYLISDGTGRFADCNGTMEEKFLYYFYAHQRADKRRRELTLENIKLVRDMIEMNKKFGQKSTGYGKFYITPHV